METFTNHKEIEQAVLAVANLMERWGLKSSEWMLGKNVSLYFAGVISNPRELQRDFTVHPLREKLPWKAATAVRSVVPLGGTTYEHDYQKTQAQFNIGIDIWPAPDQYSTKSDITKTSFVTVGGKKVNVETVAKYIKRRLVTSRDLDRKPPEKLREFYYADRKRYEERLADYQKVLAWVTSHEPNLVPQAKQLISYYKKLIYNAYPEIFTEQSSQKGELTGTVVSSAKGQIEGKVFVVGNELSVPNDSILIFSHFRPIHSPLVKQAKAIVTDGGGVLSHAAIICREYNVPCIVDTKVASTLLHTNDEVTIDLTTGIIEKTNI